MATEHPTGDSTQKKKNTTTSKTDAQRAPHPLANELTDDHLASEAPETEEIKRIHAEETVRERIEQPTSRRRLNQLMFAWVGFTAWTFVAIFISISVAMVRGSFDWLAALALLAIPLGLFFLFPIWMGYQTKSAQDEKVRRVTRDVRKS